MIQQEKEKQLYYFLFPILTKKEKKKRLDRILIYFLKKTGKCFKSPV